MVLQAAGVATPVRMQYSNLSLRPARAPPPRSTRSTTLSAIPIVKTGAQHLPPRRADAQGGQRPSEPKLESNIVLSSQRSSERKDFGKAGAESRCLLRICPHARALLPHNCKSHLLRCPTCTPSPHRAHRVLPASAVGTTSLTARFFKNTTF